MACAELESALLDRAAGALDPAAEAKLEEHLRSCAACRAEAESIAVTLGLAALPAPTDRELAFADGIAPAALSALRRERSRRSSLRRVAAGLAVAAAATLMVLLPAALRHGPHLPPVPAIEAAEELDYELDADLAGAEEEDLGAALVGLDGDDAAIPHDLDAAALLRLEQKLAAETL
jgi:anti-sigma factor RsiW